MVVAGASTVEAYALASLAGKPFEHVTGDALITAARGR